MLKAVDPEEPFTRPATHPPLSNRGPREQEKQLLPAGAAAQMP